MHSDNGLFTPEMEHAERELDARIDHALSVAREVEAKVEQLEQKVRDQEPPSDEDVERIKNYVLGYARTEEWQQVIDRINRGELTWRQVVEGLTTGTMDHRVAAAFESLSKVPPASMEKLMEIGVFPAAPPPDPAPAAAEADGDQPQAPDRGPKRPMRPAEEEHDEWFDNPLGWRRS